MSTPPTVFPILPGLVRHRPVVAYFLLALALAWGWVLAVVLPGGMPGAGGALAALFLPVFAGMAVAPPLAAAIVTLVLEGPGGLVDWLRPLWSFRAGWRDLASAVLVVPATALLILGIFRLFSADFTPAIFADGGWELLATGIGGGLVAGALEELG